jgi:TolB-like protein/DNA-binding winged helix-turn-helix (wHTH) protein/Tfp pilus assembly protein PilF
MAGQFQKRYRLGEFEIEPDKRLIKRKNKTVHLAHKPFAVLIYLIENRERVVPREELLETFWEGCDVYDVNLSKCVGAIRKALGERRDSSRFIETRWAEGYRYIGPLEIIECEPLVETQTLKAKSIVSANEETYKIVKDSVVAQCEIPTSSHELPEQIKTSRPMLIGIFGALLLLMVFGVALISYRSSSSPTKAPEVPVRSIAVLPLKNLSGDSANEYFSDGLTESLITALSRIGELKVVSRSSVFRFKGKDITPEEAGKTLGVTAVLEGSVRRENDTVQTTVRLVSVEDGSIIWASESNRRSLGDIFVLQDEIARNIAAGLRVKLSGKSEAQFSKHYTENVDAYEHYMKGRYFWNKRTEEGFRKAIGHFERAIELEPTYAMAHVGLADCYNMLSGYDYMPPVDAAPKAKAAAMKALEIDNTLAEAYTSLAYTKFFYDWDWLGVEKEFKRAIESNPNYAEAHHWYALYLAMMKRFDEAMSEMKHAQELDPLSLIVNTNIGWIHYMARRYDEAIATYQKTLEMDPTFPAAHNKLGWAYQQKKMFKEASAEFQKVFALTGNEITRHTLFGPLYAVSGKPGEAMKSIAALKELSKQKYIPPHSVALIYIGLKEKDQAFIWLDRAYNDKGWYLAYLKVDPMLDDLRSDPRFQDLLRSLSF